MSQCSGSGGRRPHVALIIETSLGSGRDILRGVARYVREHEPWALYHEPHGLEASVPQWLRRWNGDGIIARIQTRRVAQQLAASGIPVVDVLGMVPDVPFPLVSVDNTAIARMAAGHLLERGFRRFGFFGIEGENWSEQRYAGPLRRRGLCPDTGANLPPAAGCQGPPLVGARRESCCTLDHGAAQTRWRTRLQ